MLRQKTDPLHLLERLATRQGSGTVRRMRRGVTAVEVALAIEVVRIWFPDDDLIDEENARRTCSFAMDAALGADRVPNPDDDWDLVAVYARLRGVNRNEACIELGLVEKPKPKRTLLKSHVDRLLRFVTTRGGGTRRRLKKLPQASDVEKTKRLAEEVRWAVRLVQQAHPDLDFFRSPISAEARCYAFFVNALSLHDPPWEPFHSEETWDLVAIYMRLKGIKDRKKACVEMGLHEAVSLPPDPDYEYDLSFDDETGPPPGSD